MRVSSFNLFLLPSGLRHQRGTTFLASIERGLAAVAHAVETSHGFAFAQKCAEMAISAVETRDRVATNTDLGPRRQGHDSPDSLLASFQAANDLLSRAQRKEDRLEASTSMAAALIAGEGAFVAWAGPWVQVHRAGRAGLEAIAASPPSPADVAAWKAFIQDAGGDAHSLRGLGDQLHSTLALKTAQVTAEPGDLLLLSPGKLGGQDEVGQLLELAAEHRNALEPVFAEVVARDAWSSILPAVLIRFNGG